MSRGFLVRQLTALTGAVLLASIASAPASAAGNAGIMVHKTVDPAQVTINPNIAVTLAVDKATAIPADTLTYTAVVTNPSATFAMGGDINAEAHADADATVAYYWDELEVCALDCGNGMGNPNWTAVATFEAVQPGYQPVTPPKQHGGMTFAAQPIARNGIVYPGSGDPILGTVISPAATAGWTYLARVTLTPLQVARLGDPAQVQAMRNVIHMEVTVRNAGAAQPWTDPELFTNPFTSASNAGAIGNVKVTFTLPDGTTTQVPATPSLAPGGSATATATYKVPVPAARGAGETEAAYVARLNQVDGSALTAGAVAAGAGFSGTVYATASPVTTNEFVPIVTIAKSGPASIDAGNTETNPLALQNVGGATATSLAIVDSVPSSPNGTVSGPPASLAPNASGTATATYPVPISQAEGSLTDTAAVTWRDGNGDAYGPLSSSFTTTVHNLLFGADLSLAPVAAGPNPTGSTQTLTATLVDRHANPIPNQSVTFTVTGANPGTGTAVTDAAGKATFTYTGNNAGNDTAIATVVAPSITLTSNTASISWGKPLQPVVTTQVQGNFFPNPNNSCAFAATGSPSFGQAFPDILFNADPSFVPHDISNVGPATHPFTDITVDVNGNYNGQIVAQGNGFQAGNGALSNFFAAFTGSFIVSQAGDVTFTVFHDDGYILGVGNGATRVNGDLEGNPPTTTAFNGYTVVAAWDKGGNSAGSDTIHFPAPGTYPYELDYTECGGGGLQLVMTTAKFIAQTDPLSIYVGYADGLRAGGSIFPFPWQGSPGVTFVGGCTFDAGAIRFDNSGDTDITLDHVTVDLGSGGPHFDLWPANMLVPAHGILILTQTGCFNFDTSDFSNAGCGGNNNVLPLVNVTRGGVLQTFTDTGQVLNTHGFDSVCQGNESIPWQRIAGQANTVNVPLPPAVMLDLMPFSIPNAVQGQTVSVAVSALDGAGNPQVNLPVTLQVFGANAQNLTANTNASGLATFAYPGNFAGTDALQASAFISGQRALSNQGSVVWSPPGGTNNPLGATISGVAPADGTIVTKPIAISASITPPAGQSITSWQVSYQALDPGPQVVIASGTGTPPATLATFDPTLVPNDTYAITVQATASGGAVQNVTTTLVVFGNLKLGRYTTTYQDLSVPVNGFQMEVRRTYDSLDKSTGDFGVGWRVGVSNFRLAPNRILGAGGWTQYNTSCVLGLCLTGFKGSAPRSVSVTYPDGHTEVFDFTPLGGTNIFWTCTPSFTARAGTGTTSTLEAIDDTSCSYIGDGNLYGSSGLYSPKRFRLTTHDGTVFILDRTLGLVSESDRNGNKLSLDTSGIHSSNGQSITFTRDASGRITQAAGPSGQSLSYTYSTSGDLASSTDTVGNVTTYTYDSNHNLVKATGGSQPLQTFQYDASGRLVAVTDALGNTTNVANDVAGQQVTVTDPLGRLTTIFTLDDLGDVVRLDQVSGGKTLTSTATYDAVGRALTRTDPLGHVWAATYDSNGNLLSLKQPTGGGVTITYDSNGLPLTIRDAIGHQSALEYDSNGSLVKFTDPLGGVLQMTYDASGNQTSVTDPLGKTSTSTFDAFGHKTSVTDPLGHATTYSYDSSGRLINSTDALGRSTGYAYDSAGRLTSITDALGGQTTFTYNSFGIVASTTDATGKTTTYTYDANQQLTATTDPLGHATAFTFDGDGRLASRKDATGAVTAYAYDGFGRPTSETDALGHTTTYAFDDAGRLVTKTLPNGGAITYAYDANNRQTSVTDPLGRTTAASYDAAGALVSETDPTGAVTHYNVDALGRTVSITDPLGRTRSATYDAAGSVTATTDGLGRSTGYAFDAAGNTISATDPVGATTHYAYDAANQLVTITDPLGRVTHSAYDALGRLASLTLPSGSTTNYSYDALGRPTSSVDALGRKASIAYDAAGNRISSIDPNGNTTRFSHDAVGRQTSIVDALGGTASTAYDAAGRVASTTNPRGDVTRFTYDALGKVVTQTDPAGQATASTYDAAGQLTSQTDPRGTLVNFSYDAAGRLTRTAFPTGSVSFAYDAAGQRISMADPTGTTTYAYDAAGETTSVASAQGTVSYAYDGAGRRASMTVPARGAIGYAYDAAGQLTALTDWRGGVFHFAYTPDGQVSSVASPEGITSTYTYDAADQLTSIDHAGASGSVAHFAYTFDANGNTTSVTSPSGTDRYSMDALNRLVGVTYANGDTSTFTYDAAGNRLSRTDNGVSTAYTYDSAGRLATAGATAFTYDAAGNVTSAGVDTFTWDWAGRLASASVGGSTTSYAYDGDGLRVAAQAGATTARYLWDRLGSPAGNVIDDGTNAYAFAGQGLVEQAGGSGATPSFPLTDALGSVRAIAGSTGSIVGTANYDVFGSVRSQTGAPSAFGFTGQQTDSTSLIFLRARYYNPTLGRFLSADSVQPNGPGTQGYNLYSYVGNDPTTLTDPTGHTFFEYVAQHEREILVAAAFLVAVSIILRKQLAEGILALLNLLATAVQDVTQSIEQWVNQNIHTDTNPKEKPQPKPTPMCCPVLPRQDPCAQVRQAPVWPVIEGDASQINKAWKGPFFLQTVAVLEVCHQNSGVVSFYAGAQPDLEPNQQTLAGQLGVIPKVMKGLHGEQTAVEGAKQDASLIDPLEPVALFSTNKFCGPDKQNCQAYLVGQGATLAPDLRHATWQAPVVWG